MEHPRVDAVVPDASVGAKWYFDDEEDTQQARTLLAGTPGEGSMLVVPDCFFYELLNVVRRAERRRPPRIDEARATQIVAAIAALPVIVIDCRLVLTRALTLSRAWDITPYDALYLAVGERTAGTFVTADERLFKRVQHRPNVRWLGDL